MQSSNVHVGIAQYPPSQAHAYLSAVYNFAAYGSLDSKAAIVPSVVTAGANVTAYVAGRFYDSATDKAEVWYNFHRAQTHPYA